jgi:hypothetical protein
MAFRRRNVQEQPRRCDPRGVNTDRFVELCPTLWHVAPAGAWDAISRQGFRTAQQLIDASNADPPERERLTTEPRPEAVTLSVDGEKAVLRDQGALFARKSLADVLGPHLTVADWVKTLNRRVFLFATKAAADTMLEKYVARDGAQDLIVLSPWKLVQCVPSRIELSAQNSSALARRAGSEKGADTFVSMQRFPDRRPTEVTIVDGIDDLSVVVSATRIHADGRREVLAR